MSTPKAISKNNKTMLLYSGSMAAFLEFFELAKYLKQESYNPLFFQNRYVEKANMFVPTCESAGIPYILGMHFKQGQSREKNISETKPSEQDKFTSTPTGFFSLKIFFHRLGKKIYKIHSYAICLYLIYIKNPVVFISDAGVGAYNLSAFIIKLCKRRNIKTVAFVWAELFSYDHGDLKNLKEVDCIFVSSAYHEKILTDLGLAQNKIKIVGKIGEDAINDIDISLEKNKNEFVEKHGVEKKRMVVLYAVTQNAEHGFMTWEDHWKSIEEVLSALTKQPNIGILLSLHPRMIRQRYEYLEEKFSVKIIDERCFAAIPLVDIFIAGAASSMILTSLKCKVPTIMFNPYPVPHNFKEEYGVMEASTVEEFDKVFKTLTTDQQFYKTIKQKMIAAGDYFGIPDGQARKRAFQFLQEILYTV